MLQPLDLDIRPERFVQFGQRVNHLRKFRIGRHGLLCHGQGGRTVFERLIEVAIVRHKIGFLHRTSFIVRNLQDCGKLFGLTFQRKRARRIRDRNAEPTQAVLAVLVVLIDANC